MGILCKDIFTWIPTEYNIVIVYVYSIINNNVNM